MNNRENTFRNNGSTLWIGDIDESQNEDFFHQAFLMLGERLTFVKIIRNRHNPNQVAYGFLGFQDEATAQRVLQKCSGQRIPNSSSGKRWRLNTAGQPGQRHNNQAYNNNNPRRSPMMPVGQHPQSLSPRPSEYTLFVGFLSPDVDDAALMNAFKSRYPFTSSAKVILEHEGNSKGFGFVRFASFEDQQKVLNDCHDNPPELGQRKIRVSVAQPRNRHRPGPPRTPQQHHQQILQEQQQPQEQVQMPIVNQGTITGYEQYQMPFYPPIADIPQVPGYPTINYQFAPYYADYAWQHNDFNGQLYLQQQAQPPQQWVDEQQQPNQQQHQQQQQQQQQPSLQQQLGGDNFRSECFDGIAQDRDSNITQDSISSHDIYTPMRPQQTQFFAH